MRKQIVPFAAALALSAGAAIAVAQQNELTVSQDVETELREHVATSRFDPVVVEAPLAVGVALEGQVSTQPIPDEIVDKAPELRDHEFVVVEEKIYIVEPQSRKVVSVIESQ
jgi:hypothetical protein